jgi:hypothetical protein
MHILNALLSLSSIGVWELYMDSSEALGSENPRTRDDEETSDLALGSRDG